jgi:outer membrane murein-binding lipoprotein Lpp
MQLVRRLALVAVLALVGGIVLSGCRSEPRVAAYVGDTKFTVDQVDAVMSQLDKINAGRDPAQQAPTGRQFVVSLMVYGELAQRLIDQKGLTPAKGGVEAVSSSFDVPADGPYAQLFGNYLNRFGAVRLGPGSDAAPSREQVLRYYHAGVDAGVYPAGVSDDEVVQKLSTAPDAVKDLAAQHLLDEAGKQNHLVVNPRYAPLTLPFLIADQNGNRLAALPFVGSDDPFVTEAR